MTTHALSSPAGSGPAPLSRKSIALGIVSFAPLVSLAAALVTFFMLFLRFKQAVDDPFGPEQTSLDSGFSLYLVLLVISAVTSMVAFVALVVDAITREALTQDQRIMWVVVLVLANVVAFPIYWYVVHWRAQRRPVSAPSSRSIDRSS
jgi:magnesium-transporting ATPase (P-type)